MSQPQHISVLKDEAVDGLNLDANDLVVDATYGGGGHAWAILARLNNSGKLLVIDHDADAIHRAHDMLGNDARVEIIHTSFSNLSEILKARGLHGRVDAMLFDLGVSSQQLDTPERGFSFNATGPLDMRMNRTKGISAAEWLLQVSEQELSDALRSFGEERFARRIARSIKRALADDLLMTTTDLANIVATTVPSREPGKHPATRTFQAIRIAVNAELDEVQSVLPQALTGLALGGRLVFISFHSLEDRLVKRFFRVQAKGDPYPPEIPITEDMKNPTLKLIGKAIRTSQTEIASNRRARSAVMRIAEKIAQTVDCR